MLHLMAIKILLERLAIEFSIMFLVVCMISNCNVVDDSTNVNDADNGGDTTRVNDTTQIKDYLPLEIGNYWVYKIDYVPDLFNDALVGITTGTVKWTINKITLEDGIKIYSVEQIINGIKVKGLNFSDTVIITNRKDEFEFIEYNDGYVEFAGNDYFLMRIKIKRFYTFTYSLDTLTLKAPAYYFEGDRLISLDGESHEIKLVKELGIKEWKVRATHNSGPRGDFLLLDYRINN